MKLKIATTIAIMALAMPVFVPASALQTQETTENRPKSQSPDQVVQMYNSKLNLTEDQKQRILPIVVERQRRMLELRIDTSVKGREKMMKMKSVMENSDSRINAVLNPDQRQKYSELEAERKEKMKERMEEKHDKK
jgi:Spy/CpxP family protein refolding chaperone